MIELALYIIGCVISMALFCYFGAAVLTAIYYICVGIKIAWENLNSFGRAVFFGTPMLVAAYFVFYFIFYTAIPFYLENEVARIISYIVLGVVAYFSLLGIGWCYGNLKIKNEGVIPLIARIIFLLPYLPLLYVGFYAKQIFCKAFISNNNICWNPHFITLKTKYTYKFMGHTYKFHPVNEIEDDEFASYNEYYDKTMSSVKAILKEHDDFIKNNYVK